MKYGMIIDCADFLPFFINAANLLKENGIEVYFLNPNWYMRFILRREELEYILYTEQSFCEKTQELDQFIIWNGTGNYEADLLLKNNRKSKFVELGYFPKTMQINSKGVNAAAEYSAMELHDFMKLTFGRNNDINTEFKLKKVKIKYFSVYSLYLILFYRLRLFGQIIQLIKNNVYKWKFKRLPLEEVDFPLYGDYILFPLQVNCDSQILHNSQYESMYDVLRRVVPLIKKSPYKLIIKEHPYEREHVDYSEFVDGEKIILLKKCDLESAIENSKFVMTVNSSVGLQSIALHKKTLVLGDCFYVNSPISLQNTEISNLLSDLEVLDRKQVNAEEIDKYINHFKKNIFEPVNFFNFGHDDIVRFCQRVMG